MNIKKEPITSRLRIKNKVRFTLFVSILIITILAVFMPVEKQNISYRKYQVGYGDTYWGLARDAQNNGYREDIRIIVDEMIEKSGIQPHELKEGDIVWIPEVKK